MINSRTQAAILDIVDFVKPKKITHLVPGNKTLSGNSLQLRKKDTINFGSCSYLGLEFNEDVQAGGINAIRNFGTQFSISRAYMSCPLYTELEDNFRSITGHHIVVSPTTTLGHMAAIPAIFTEKDAVILDHQVHSSVQMGVQLIKSNGVKVEMIRHSRMDLLEEKVNKLSASCERIWYMADGIYSMYGDKAPLDEIYELMEKYPKLHLYIDDAHGMSCYGDKGEGYVLSHSSLNDRTIVALSMAKGFGSGGAVFVFKREDWARKMQVTGLTMITSGPIQPAVLGACVESSQIHLNQEKISALQTVLKENIKYTNILLGKFNLPLLHTNDSPIFFIGVGLPKTGRNLMDRMLDEGFMPNLGIFPAVPVKNTGIRFTITALHTFEQIEAFVERLAYHYHLALEEENVTMDEVCKCFGLPTEDYRQDAEIRSVIKYSELSVEINRSVSEMDSESWNELFSFNGQLNTDQLTVLEEAYSGNDLKEHNWEFAYVTIKNSAGKIILAAPFTAAWQKDDLFSSSAVSAEIEKIRHQENPYYLTSRVLTMGSPIATGKSLFYDETSPILEEAIDKFCSTIIRLQNETGTQSVILRDFTEIPEVILKRFEASGFFRTTTMKSYTINHLPSTMEDYKSILSKNSKRHIKRKAEKFSDLFEYEVVTNYTVDQVKGWYALYENVASQKTEVNTFRLPLKLFTRLLQSNFWEVHVLKTKAEKFKSSQAAVGVLFVHKTDKVLTPNYIGLDYDFKDFHIYQQLMYNVLNYAIKAGYDQIDLGVTADFEKERLGATGVELQALLQVDDHYNLSHLEAVHGNLEKKEIVNFNH